MRRMVWGRCRRAPLAVVLTAAACTSAAPSPVSTTIVSTHTVVVTGTRTTTAAAYAPPPTSTVHPLPPGAKPRAGEREGRCPYIRAGLNEDPAPAPTVADIEGSRVARTTILTAYHPLGCRFYYAYPPYGATADIRPTTLASATQAHNAMVQTARQGRQLQVMRNFVPGVDGIGFRTTFFGDDGSRDWAFAFAKGRVMVVVRTQRTDTSRNALYLAQAIAGKF